MRGCEKIAAEAIRRWRHDHCMAAFAILVEVAVGQCEFASRKWTEGVRAWNRESYFSQCDGYVVC